MDDIAPGLETWLSQSALKLDSMHIIKLAVSSTHLDKELLEHALAPGGLSAVYQPVVRLEDYRVVAHEGLMRVSGSSASPLVALDAARRLGRLGELETAAASIVATQYDFACADEPSVMARVSAFWRTSSRCSNQTERLLLPDDLLIAVSKARRA